MTNRLTPVWGIHGGKTGDADSLFLQGNCVAIGWPDVGDLSSIPNNREAFKTKLQSVYPQSKPGAIPVNAGQLFRFVHEIAIGDIVVYPSGSDRHIHLGRVDGQYRYYPEGMAAYPNVRAVTWIKHIPRTSFTQGALYEIGSAISLFLIRNYSDEFRAVLNESTIPNAPMSDATIGLVSENVEETTGDFILKRLSQELKGHPLADFVAHLLGTMGYRSRVSPAGPDGGVDILAHKDELGFEPPIIKVQVKSSGGSIGQPDVSALLGTLSHGEYALMITLGSYSHPARNFARGKSNLRLIDGTELVEIILSHYEQLEGRYKALIPLKRIYVLEVIEQSP